MSERPRSAGCFQAARREVRGLQLGELVAHTAHGLDVAGIPGIVLYFLSNISDVHVRRADLTVEISVPELFHNLLSAVPPPRMRREAPEPLELRGGQIDAVLADPDLTAQKIDHEAGEYKPLIRGFHAPTPEVSSYATHHLKRANRLGNVVVGPHFEAQDDAPFPLASGEHNYGYVAALPEFLAEGDPVDSREH